MASILWVILSPILLLFSWIGLRFLYCVYNYKIYKNRLRHLPAVKDPFARLKSFIGDPGERLWKENIELAGKGNAFCPVVFIGPYMDMGRPLVMVNSPDLIREISDDALFPKLPAFYEPLKTVIGSGLVTEVGDRWRKMRTSINPLFYHARLKNFSKHMTASADELISFLRTKKGAEVDCDEVLSEATLRIFVDSVFSRSDFDPKWTSELLQKSTRLATVYTLAGFLVGPTLNSFLPWTRALNFTRKVIHDKVALLCERARNSPTDESTSSNFVEMLVSLKEDGKQVLSDAEIAEHAMTFLFVGYDTSKNAVAWTLYFLCQDRKELEKLHKEVDSVLKGRNATDDDIPNLPKVKNAIMEALRLRPGGNGVERATPEDVELGGYFIPKGTALYINWHAAHTDPTLWEKPEAFYPDRFDEHPGYVKNYFAFSCGPRNCIGQKFALNESIILTASLLRQFDIQMGSGKVTAITKFAQDAHGFNCKFIPRK
eukprot:Phypoly_transcript_08566.p1 GENE.Phypoly_transcript_08566~~Phypoly_transcript_08566.p1  ORF type:complete len:487 (+),score=39.74 Phypoly_transcript_08566:35-1495(+)